MSFPSENLPTGSEQSVSATQGSTIHDVNQGTFSGSPQNVQIGDNKFYASNNREELNSYIKHAVTAYSSSQFSRILPSNPSSPYKLLDSFRVEDESIFFGREQAVKELCKTVQKARLTVLHARSGAGKSSLLQAGLSPNFIRQRRLPLYIRTYEKDPSELIKQALVGTRSGWPDLLSDLSLHEFFTIACSYLPREHSSEFLLILDQFEDFFLYKTEPAERLPFIKALGECQSDQNLPLRIVIALRKDYYSDLAEFDRVLPNIDIFRNYYQTLPMTRQEAQAAIVQPLVKSIVSYDPALLEILLNDLERGEIELPLLQILCTRLYDTRQEGEAWITLDQYQTIGGMEGVLKNYLLEVLNGLPEQYKKLAQKLLKALLRSDGTKQALSDKQVELFIEVQKNELEQVLGQLVRARLLRRDEIEGEIRYELVHDYLATEIGKWVDPEEQELKQAEELLRRELMSWKTHRTLIPRQRLEILFPYRKHFKRLTKLEWEGLLTSVLKEEYAIGFWILLAGEMAENVLLKIAEESTEKFIQVRALNAMKVMKDLKDKNLLLIMLQEGNDLVREDAAKAIGELGKVEAVDLLIRALQDENEGIRSSAAEALGKLGKVEAVEPLIKVLQNEDELIHGSVAEALGKLGKVEAVEPLIKVLRDEDKWVRIDAAEALVRLGKVEVLELLVRLLQDEAKRVRINAAGALGRIGRGEAVEPLIKALQDEDEDVRSSVAGALGKFSGQESEDILIAMLYDKDDFVRLSAAESLDRINIKGCRYCFKKKEEEKKVMMDVAQIAASVVALLAPFTPYLVEAGKAAGGAAAKTGGEVAWEKAKSLWEKIHAHAGEDKKLQGAALMVSADPEDESMQATFAKALGAHLEADPAFAEELVRLMGGSQAVQEVIAEHQSLVENVGQQLKGAGKQTVRASDNSAIRGVRQSKE
ncbi:MAG: HEAT repeat domain-containing protein [Ktedonobacteraceae bacterium]|nr:HEAT repeat domain-containing protein [Ktedonobacteraceae bacterium]